MAQALAGMMLDEIFAANVSTATNAHEFLRDFDGHLEHVAILPHLHVRQSTSGRSSKPAHGHAHHHAWSDVLGHAPAHAPALATSAEASSTEDGRESDDDEARTTRDSTRFLYPVYPGPISLPLLWRGGDHLLSTRSPPPLWYALYTLCPSACSRAGYTTGAGKITSSPLDLWLAALSPLRRRTKPSLSPPLSVAGRSHPGRGGGASAIDQGHASAQRACAQPDHCHRALSPGTVSWLLAIPAATSALPLGSRPPPAAGNFLLGAPLRYDNAP